MGYITPESFAERLGHNTTAWWVRRELIAGRIVGSKIRRRWYIDEAEVEALVKRNTNQKPGADQKAKAS